MGLQNIFTENELRLRILEAEFCEIRSQQYDAEHHQLRLNAEAPTAAEESQQDIDTAERVEAALKLQLEEISLGVSEQNDDQCRELRAPAEEGIDIPVDTEVNSDGDPVPNMLRLNPYASTIDLVDMPHLREC